MFRRMTNEGVEINRLIDRVLKESRPIDTESLCVLAGEKVCISHCRISFSFYTEPMIVSKILGKLI